MSRPGVAFAPSYLVAAVRPQYPDSAGAAGDRRAVPRLQYLNCEIHVIALGTLNKPGLFPAGRVMIVATMPGLLPADRYGGPTAATGDE
jgi:hypothetical protein